MTHDIVAIGASAGGLEPLRRIVADLPEGLDATLFVVIHTSAEGPGYLAHILNEAGKIEATFPQKEQKFERGKIYVAPPDFHLLVGRGTVRVVRGPKENRHRPAIDPLFRSVAAQYGARVVGVLLSGMLDDGVSGLHAIKQCGGKIIVQDPKEALFGSMPERALRNVAVDHCVRSESIARIIDKLSKTPIPKGTLMKAPKGIVSDVQMAAVEKQGEELLDHLGKRSTLTCPECHGALWEIDDETILRFRCHIGHAYTAESLAVDETDAVQRALSIAVRTLEDSAYLAGKMAKHAKEQGRQLSHKLFADRRKEAVTHADVLRQIMMKDGAPRIEKRQSR